VLLFVLLVIFGKLDPKLSLKRLVVVLLHANNLAIFSAGMSCGPAKVGI
jgi:hypothetical protein